MRFVMMIVVIIIMIVVIIIMIVDYCIIMIRTSWLTDWPAAAANREFSAAMASLRAVAFFLAPSLWGSIYAACVRAGRPPGLALVGAGLVGALLPAMIHRSISAEDWSPKAKPKSKPKAS